MTTAKMLSLSVFLWSSSLALAWLLLSRYRKLSSVPGPLLASFTDLWRAYHVRYGGLYENMAQIHARYGTFVRIAPNAVSISDPAAIGTVYSMHGEFKKADSYHALRVLSNGKIVGSVIDMQDEAEVSALRRAVGSAFATKNVLDYESDVDYTAGVLIGTLREVRTVEVFGTMQQFQVDFLMKAAFSRNTDYLASRKSTKPISGHHRLRHWMKWHSLPSLEKLLYKSPLCKGWYGSVGSPPPWTAMAMEELEVRRQQDGGLKGDKKPDLLTKYLEGAQRHADSISTAVLLRLISSTISAGFDTSAFTMTTILYYLLKNPDAMKKLRAEVEAAFGIGQRSDPPSYAETNELEYLGAVIKESMRLFHFLHILLEREVPAGGAEIAGRWFPGGTTVAVPAQVVHFDPAVFGDDAAEFRPDRWVEADEPQRLTMEKTMLGFGAGKRICIGKHMAELEIKKVIPRLLLEFDLTLDDPEYILRGQDPYDRFPRPFTITFNDKAEV